MFALDNEDWLVNESEKTYYTNEQFLPRILVDLGIYPSISEIRRNKPQLMVNLDSVNFIDDLKVSKKRRVWILIGKNGCPILVRRITRCANIVKKVSP